MDTTTVTAIAVGGDDNGGNSKGTAMTAAGTPMTDLGVGKDRIVFTTIWEGCGCWLWRLCVGLCVLVVCVLRAHAVLLETTAYWGSPESSW
jgi:hypothetical protein